MERNIKNLDSIKKTNSSIVDLRQRQEREESMKEVSSAGLEPKFQDTSEEIPAKNSKRFGIKFWAFLVLPLIAVSIGIFFAFQEFKKNSSSELFSQEEIKAGSKEIPLPKNDQNAQTGQVSQKQNKSAIPPPPQKEEAVPPVESEKAFSFAIFGDTQDFKAEDSEGNFQKAVKSIESLNPDKIIAIGDLVSSCNEKDCEEKLNSWKNEIGLLSTKLYAVQGNHDRTGGKKSDEAWQKVFDFPTNGPEGFSELTYSFDFENSHFVILDSDNPKEHSVNLTQRDWLEKDLAENKKDNTFIFFHEPAYPTSSKIKESLDAKSEDRDALWKILDTHNVSAVFSGHEHLNSRRKIDSAIFSEAKNSLNQLIVGNTDTFDHKEPKEGTTDYSYKGKVFMIINVQGKKITFKVYSVDGEELNSFELTK